MPNPNTTCPYAATTVRFNAYGISADFEYRPDSGEPIKQQLIYSRFESPSPFSARASAICEIKRIKGLLDQGLGGADEKYQFEGIQFWMEFQIGQPCGDTSPEIKKLYLLDGKIGTRDDILQRLSSEEFLLDMMGYTFVRGIVDGNDAQDYAAMVVELFEGLIVINADLFCK